jgi:hypothetical protein
MNGHALLKAFQRTLKDAGVRQIRFHDLRHTFGTRMAAAGVPMRTLQAWMGHAHIETTHRYADYAPSAHEVDFVNAAFALPNVDSHCRAGTNPGTKLSPSHPNLDQLGPQNPYKSTRSVPDDHLRIPPAACARARRPERHHPARLSQRAPGAVRRVPPVRRAAPGASRPDRRSLRGPPLGGQHECRSAHPPRRPRA